MAASLLTGSSLGETLKYFGGTKTIADLGKVEIKTQCWAETCMEACLEPQHPCKGWTWWYLPGIPQLERQKQEDPRGSLSNCSSQSIRSRLDGDLAANWSMILRRHVTFTYGFQTHTWVHVPFFTYTHNTTHTHAWKHIHTDTHRDTHRHTQR